MPEPDVETGSEKFKCVMLKVEAFVTSAVILSQSHVTTEIRGEKSDEWGLRTRPDVII